MGALYTLTVVVAYGRYGSEVTGFLPATLPQGWAKRITGLGLCYHICVAFLITFQPLGEKMQTLLFKTPAHTEAILQRRHFLITAAFLAGSFLIANLIPFFSDFQMIIGSALGAPIVFGEHAAAICKLLLQSAATAAVYFCS